jgi:hypothetical protein
MAAAIFYGLAGINHAMRAHRTKLEDTTMASNIFAALVLAFCFFGQLT